MFKKENLILFFFSMNNFTLKVLYFSIKQTFSPVSEFIRVPMAPQFPASRGAQAGKTHLCGPKQRRKTWCLHHKPFIFLFFIYFFLITTLYIGKVALGNSSLKMHKGERNLSSKCCQTWQDAEEWCICLMYLQRNENTITWSLFWALHFSSAAGPHVIKLLQTYLITEVSSSIYIVADDLWLSVCVLRKWKTESEEEEWMCVHVWVVVSTDGKQRDNTQRNNVHIEKEKYIFYSVSAETWDCVRQDLNESKREWKVWM